MVLTKLQASFSFGLGNIETGDLQAMVIQNIFLGLRVGCF